MTSHTPAPWIGRYNGDDPVDGILIEAAGQTLALVNCPEETIYEGKDYKTYTHPDVLFANARLIAAAPELLEVVRGMASLSILVSDFDTERDLIERARALLARIDDEAVSR